MQNTIVQLSNKNFYSTMSKTLCVVVLLLLGSFAQAQNASAQAEQLPSIGYGEVALTPAMRAQIAAAKERFSTNASGMSLVPMYVPVRLNIPLKDDGTGGVTESSAFSGFCQLQQDLAPYNIHVYMKDTIRYIRNTTLWTMASTTTAQQQDAGRDATLYDIYLVPTAMGGTACSFTNRQAGYSCMAINCTAAEPHTWTNVFGIWAGLYRTFSGWEFQTPTPGVPAPTNSERVDGSNCQTAADLLCDTPPDYLYNRWTCVNGLSADTYLDPAGVAFRIDGTNYMSSSNGACQNRFSPQQVTNMFAYTSTTRAAVVNQPAPTPIPAVTTLATNLLPANNATLNTTTTATLTWSRVPNATMYLVEVAVNSFFSSIVKTTVIADTTIVLDALTANRTYYWRVRPLNQQNTCLLSGVSIFKFKTATVVGTESTNTEAEALSIMPNPVQQGQPVLLDVSILQGDKARLLITNMAGQIIQDKELRILPQYQYEINTADLPKGIHFVTLQNENGIAVCKMVVL
jgi:hypothetical protein